MAQTNLSTEQKQTHRQRTDLVAKGEEGGSGMDRELGVGRCKLLDLEWISNENLLYSTGNYIQSLGIDLNGRQHEKKNAYIGMTESLCCTAEIDTAPSINYTLMKIKFKRNYCTEL